ncbi:MAG: putative cytokinetic ring protein SteA [Frankiaceae bacterium]
MQPEQPSLGSGPHDRPREIRGRARLDRCTKNLTRRLRPGDVAVLDHRDIDRVSAEALIARRVAAVVNAAPSISGRYPNLGPQLLVSAGIPVLDQVGGEVFDRVRDGDVVTLDGDRLVVATTPVASGTPLDPAAVSDAMERARAGIAAQIEAFAANTMDFLLREQHLLFDGVDLPDMRTRIRGLQVLVVVRGPSHREDLASLRPYIRDQRPVLIGVDGGADALREAGYRPDLIVGDMDSVSDDVLACGAELVVHAYRDGQAPGLARVTALGLPAVVFPAAGTSEDVALLLADEQGATLIVAVGTHGALDEFLDKGRAGMSSTFLTRLRVGNKLVDATGMSHLYRREAKAPGRLLVAAATLTVIGFILAVCLMPGTGLEVVTARLQSVVPWLASAL